MSVNMLSTHNKLSLFAVVVVIFLIMLIIRCCLDNKRPRKVTKKRRFQQSYENIPQESVTPISRAPPQETILTRIDDTDIDGIVVIPDPDEASPVVVPPYPVEPRHPTPHAMPPGPGFAAHNPPYPTHTPHPTPGAAPYPPVGGHSPYPPITGATPYPPSAAPYPPTGPPVGSSAPYPDYSAHPPSYSEAVAQPPLPVKDGYSKQAPYNPNY